MGAMKSIPKESHIQVEIKKAVISANDLHFIVRNSGINWQDSFKKIIFIFFKYPQAEIETMDQRQDSLQDI